MPTDSGSNRDEIVYFPSVKSYNQANKKGKYKVKAFNTTKNKLIWETDEFEVQNHLSNITGRNLILINNQLIIPLGGTQLMSLDIRNGEKLWSTITDQMTFTNYIHQNGKISFLTGLGELYMIEANTGKLISKKTVFMEIQGVGLITKG